MKMTEDFIPEGGPWRARQEAEASAWAATDHRRNLQLVAAAGLALGLALAGGLAAAWQADRWLADWHYGVEYGVYMLPEDSGSGFGGAGAVE